MGYLIPGDTVSLASGEETVRELHREIRELLLPIHTKVTDR
jgi:hypothetical protein